MFGKICSAAFCSLVVILVTVAGNLPQSATAEAELASAAAATFNRVDQERPGLVSQRPDELPYVETELGFMVPFTMEIPGTDVQFEMVPIPGGTFLMGSPEGQAGLQADEGPQISVELKPFWMGKYEVTWAEYRAYMQLQTAFREMQQQGIRPVSDPRAVDAITAPSALYDPRSTFDAGDGPRQPAATMTQFAARQYTKWLSLITEDLFRLPSEAEWEYACRAGTTTAYHFGDDPSQLDLYGWFEDNSQWQRHDVGQKRPNPWGLYDMHGNVAEWVLDQYHADWYSRFGERTMAGEEVIAWPSAVFPRVVRGGSFELPAEACRSAARLASDDEAWKLDDPNYPKSPWWYTTEPATGVGFRLVRPLIVPDDPQRRAAYWDADVDQLLEDVQMRINQEGRGAFGIADPDLPAAIEKMRQSSPN